MLFYVLESIRICSADLIFKDGGGLNKLLFSFHMEVRRSVVHSGMVALCLRDLGFSEHGFLFRAILLFKVAAEVTAKEEMGGRQKRVILDNPVCLVESTDKICIWSVLQSHDINVIVKGFLLLKHFCLQGLPAKISKGFHPNLSLYTL